MGILVAGIGVGLFDTMVQVPHEDDEEDTRVPVVEEYVPVIPVMLTSDPVTAPTPPPDTQAGGLSAVVASASQLPCVPDAPLSYARVEGGRPTPV